MKHLLGIENLTVQEIDTILDRANDFVNLNRQSIKQSSELEGKTQINIFFENSTRTQASFELAGKRLGADVMNLGVDKSSVGKGETLIDTALTLNAMQPDILVIRHPSSGAANLLSDKVHCSVINAGDGTHEHPTQALLDALTIQRTKKTLSGLKVAICGDIKHSRVARSNIQLLGKKGNLIRLVGPRTLMPSEIEELGVEIYHDLEQGLKGVDIVMMLRLQKERMAGALIPSVREYYKTYGLTYEKLQHARKDAIVMHPGPMNRGIEIDGNLADDINHSVIQNQVEFGVATRMAVMCYLCQND
ncbi:MAG: aspartate carbamoyltransferase catalytic subunit [Paracoccaceae bacterium]|nr:aspartate carbamoyltransferase catalytic subunit [Paracoccaceae bacterium]MDE2676011.1 aspartate carbamoyltransferase catalytic subunit [Paracoccaceae bacterium]MYG09487.1 aspartate carbamoyltransferase catalytic subunit [Paracoccaceae bacterium]MYJ86385.1 aspartate carbamoyltransferase catalytic subunit [Paracoccaceae bacterium]